MGLYCTSTRVTPGLPYTYEYCMRPGVGCGTVRYSTHYSYETTSTVIPVITSTVQ